MVLPLVGEELTLSMQNVVRDPGPCHMGLREIKRLFEPCPATIEETLGPTQEVSPSGGESLLRMYGSECCIQDPPYVHTCSSSGVLHGLCGQCVRPESSLVLVRPWWRTHR